MPLPPHPLGEPFEGEVFLAADALARGIARSRLRAGDLSAPFRGVRMPKSTSLRGSALIPSSYSPLMRDGRWFSHATAAELFDIPLPRSASSAKLLHVSVRSPAAPPQQRGVVGHRLFGEFLVGGWRGLPVVSPADTWCHLASVLSLTDLIVAGDHLVRKKHALSTVAELSAAVERMGRARGCRNARIAIGRIRPGTESPRESLLRLAIVDAGLPEPLVGHSIRNSLGDFVANPDLAYVEQRIAIEYEGEVHRTDPRVYAADILRREAIEKAGWQIILVISEHLMRTPALLLARIAQALADRAELPPIDS